MKATEQHFPVVLFIMLYKVVFTFESAHAILKATEQYFPVTLSVFNILPDYFFPHKHSLSLLVEKKKRTH